MVISEFYNKVYGILDKCVPKFEKQRDKYSPWLTNVILKERVRNKFKTTSLDKNKQKYIEYHEISMEHGISVVNVNKENNRLRCASCIGSECDLPITSLATCDDAIKCYSAVVRWVESDGLWSERLSRGCWSQSNQLTVCPTMGSSGGGDDAGSDVAQARSNSGQYRIICCSAYHFCNNHSFNQILPPSQQLPSPAGERLSWKMGREEGYVLIGGAALVLVLAALVAMALSLRGNRKRSSCSSAISNDDTECSINSDMDDTHRYFLHLDTFHSFPIDDRIRATPAATASATVTIPAALVSRTNNHNIKEYSVQSMSSGSGFGLPILTQRTLSKQIRLIEQIGVGKFGQVWRGQWKDQSVAVKIFTTLDEASYYREIELYTTNLLRHPNIVNLVGSDVISSMHSSTQHWLVTDYMEQGSLYDYLNRRPYISSSQAVNIALSVVSGLQHLHRNIFGVQGKPEIAHRDLKSKNILVKNGEKGECVLADFGLAVTNERRAGNDDEYFSQPPPWTSNLRVGTKRYMAPEILDESAKTGSFESLKRADIYALSLVMWEVMRRTRGTHGDAEPYAPPYYQHVSEDPSFDHMKLVVCDLEQRPIPPVRFHHQHPFQWTMTSIMEECWDRKPCRRLSALRIKKDLMELRRKVPAEDEESDEKQSNV